jgi:hypothetical protein
MHADTAILTGTRHTAAATPCQDYTAAGALPDGRVWGVIADGCSTGGETDLGARAWALAAREVLKVLPDIDAHPQDLQELLLDYAKPMLSMLAHRDGFATLGVVQARDKDVRATVFGDGVLIARHWDGGITFINISYSDNAPFYLNYLREPAQVEAWRTQYPGQLRRVVAYRLDEAGEMVGMKVTEEPGETPWVWSAHVDKDELDFVALATDGATDCGDGLLATVAQFAAVKNPAGEFMKRRIAKLARGWQKTGHMPGDDLAVAAIWLGELPTGAADNTEAVHG